MSAVIEKKQMKNGVVILTMNRPRVLNAMSKDLIVGLLDTFKEIEKEQKSRVVVLTGKGKGFCSGADLANGGWEVEKALTRGQAGADRMEKIFNPLVRLITSIDKPVITAVNGICCGGGFHWVADADIVIAASDAQFFDPHVSVGQVVAIEAIGLMKKMPVEAVMRMAFMGKYERMDAERARELGMVSEIVDPPERLRERAQELGETIAKNSPAAMAATKKALWGALEHGLTDACKAGAQHLVSMWGHPDQNEGPMAFAEKRDPNWKPLS